jgi:hypothetical protein
MIYTTNIYNILIKYVNNIYFFIKIIYLFFLDGGNSAQVPELPHNHNSDSEKVKLLRFKDKIKQTAQISLGQSTVVLNSVINSLTPNTIPACFNKKQSIK